MRSIRSLLCGETSERGSVVILVAVLMAGLLGIAGLAVDFGHAADEHRKTQNAADAAALQAAYDIYTGKSESDATGDATTILAKYGYSSANLTSLTFLDSSGNTTATPASVARVRTKISSTISTYLMGIVGVRTVTVAGGAAASVSGSWAASCAICIMDTGSVVALSGTGSAVASATGGNIVVNSSEPNQAIKFTGSAGASAPAIQEVGGYSTTSSVGATPLPTQIASPIPDPFPQLQPPTCATGNPLGTASYNLSSGTATVNPGTYAQLTASGGVLTLNSGVYCILTKLGTSGPAKIIGHNVLLYFTCGTWPTASTCASGQSGGAFTLTGSGGYDLSAQTSGTYAGLAIYYDRNNTAAFTMTGSTTSPFTGTVYALSSPATLTGTAGTQTFNSMFVFDTVTLTGQGTVNVSYSSSQNYGSGVPALVE